MDTCTSTFLAVNFPMNWYLSIMASVPHTHGKPTTWMSTYILFGNACADWRHPSRKPYARVHNMRGHRARWMQPVPRGWNGELLVMAHNPGSTRAWQPWWWLTWQHSYITCRRQSRSAQGLFYVLSLCQVWRVLTARRESGGFAFCIMCHFASYELLSHVLAVVCCLYILFFSVYITAYVSQYTCVMKIAD